MRSLRTQRQAILVLGMHRSGTSALTRVISLCGAGLPQTIMAPAPDNNETGFWESRVLADFHDEVLAAMGSTWSDVRSLPKPWFESDAASIWRERLAALIDDEFATMPLFVVKDPRLCRLLPLWLPVLEAGSIVPRVVIPLRHPLEVAASLQRREGFATGLGLMLWLCHMLAAERDSRGLPRSFVSYDEVLTDWRGAMTRIGTDLGIDWQIGEATEAAIATFLSPDLRHHAVAGAEGLPPWAAQAHAALGTAVIGGSVDRAEMDRIAAILTDAEAHFGPVIGALDELLAQRTAERQHWIDAAVERYAVIEDLRAEIERRVPRPAGDGERWWRRLFGGRTAASPPADQV